MCRVTRQRLDNNIVRDFKIKEPHFDFRIFVTVVNFSMGLSSMNIDMLWSLLCQKNRKTHESFKVLKA